MTKYQQAKNKIRDLAVDWQSDFGNNNYSWLELFQWQEFFSTKAKQYGLIREFRENGIIWKGKIIMQKTIEYLKRDRKVNDTFKEKLAKVGLEISYETICSIWIYLTILITIRICTYPFFSHLITSFKLHPITFSYLDVYNRCKQVHG